MTKLSVNVNKVAYVRNTRELGIPSVTWAAETAVAAGAYGITAHPRPDQRHIRPGDVIELAMVEGGTASLGNTLASFEYTVAV